METDTYKQHSVRKVLKDDVSSRLVGSPSVMPEGSSSDQFQKIVDMTTTQSVNKEIKEFEEGSFGVTTTLDERRKFAERLKKYRMRIIQQRQAQQKHETTGKPETKGEIHKRHQEAGETSTNGCEKLKEQQRQCVSPKICVGKEIDLPVVLKRSLPSSSGIDQMEADEQERIVRQKLAANVRDIQKLLKSYPTKPQRRNVPNKHDDFNVHPNSALYDFLTVSLCSSPVSPKPVAQCTLQRSFSAPPCLLLQKNDSNTNDVESDGKDKIGDFVGSSCFWDDILLMESECR